MTREIQEQTKRIARRCAEHDDRVARYFREQYRRAYSRLRAV